MTHEGVVRVWRPAGDSAGDFLCYYVESGGGAAHVHEEWQFAVAEGPAGVSVGAFRRYAARLEDVSVIAPYEVHAERSGVTRPEWRILHVAAPVVARLHRAAPDSNGHPQPHFAGPVLNDPAAAVQLRCLLRCSENGELADEFVPRILEWLARLLKHHATTPGGPARRDSVERARAYLRDHPTQPTNLDELVTVAGISSSHLARSFSRLVGLPPRSYHTQVRLAHARRLLTLGHPATRVAYECGFADQSHLNRRFKQCYGLTPGAFQAQYFALPSPSTAAGSDAA